MSAAAEQSPFGGEMAELLDSFIAETREIIEKLDQELTALEKNPADSALHNTIFRAVHTIKGTSSFLGFQQMTELAHVFEDVLNKIRKNELAVTAGVMDVMFEAFDLLKELLARFSARNPAPVELTAILAKLTAVSKGIAVPAKEAAPAAPAPPPPPAVEAPAPAPEDSASAPQAPADRQEGTPPAAEAPQAGQAKTTDTTIRVDVVRLDNLMNLVGELVLGRNRLAQISERLDEQGHELPAVRELAETSRHLDLITTELQSAMMKTRMVPIARVFQRLPRLMRDISRETHKEYELLLSGEETELDKSIVEELTDPLVHLLRNSGDHGIEDPGERLRLGKPSRGLVAVTAEHQGDNIVISVSDDGRGMDPEKLKQKAIEKGLITDAEAREMTKQDALALIFLPGFSTATRVTSVSGRGVGMDVVQTNISKLKGVIEVESEIGKGTTVVIKLPLTLVIIQGLLATACGEIYCLPLHSVIEVVRVRSADIQTINRKEVITLRDSIIPLADLREVFDVPGERARKAWVYIIVIGLAERRLGVLVDSLLGQKEVVIKTLGAYLGSVPGIAGSTIMGDGRTAMVLDAGEFMSLCGRTKGAGRDEERTVIAA